MPLRSMLLCKSNKMFWSQEWTSYLALSWGRCEGWEGGGCGCSLKKSLRS